MVLVKALRPRNRRQQAVDGPCCLAFHSMHSGWFYGWRLLHRCSEPASAQTLDGTLLLGLLFMFGDRPHSMNDAWNPAQQRQQHINDECCAQTIGQKNAQRWQKNSQNEAD